MRSFAPDYELRTPGALAEALELLAREPGQWKPLAGGTDLMALFEAGKLESKRLLNLQRLGELKGIEAGEGGVSIGALATYSEIRRHAGLAREFPLLAQAARETGGVAIQNRGTLGGNIVNASPAGDSLPPLLVYEAELELVSARGARRVPYAAFHRGYRLMDLGPDELLARIHIPRPDPAWRHYYRKVGGRRAQAISKVCFAGLLRSDSVRIALGAVAPTPVRCYRTEALLRGRQLSAGLVDAARDELQREISPIDDMRSTARYRRRVAGNLLDQFLVGQASRPVPFGISG